ncbi:MAG: metallophosphoesterase [Deltaproteobacteria bacterium]|nr:metallophosphoesterase [Deltaproteobacteria bacterium]
MKKIFLITFAFLLTLLLAFAAHSWYLGNVLHKKALAENQQLALNLASLKHLKEHDGEGPFRFIVLGDIQAGFNNLTKLVHPAVGAPPHFIIQTGDLVSHADDGHYSLVLHELEKADLRVPFLVVPGNHDVEGGEYLFHTYFGPRQYHFFWHQCLFIIMDNSLGSPYTRQVQWLKEVFRKHHHKAKHTFLLMHREPMIWKKRYFYPAFNNYLSFFLLLREFRIDYIFSGHLHDYRRAELKGTVFISNGKEGRIGGFLQSKPNFLTLVEVGENGIQDFKIPVYQSVMGRIYGWYIDTSVAHFYPWFKRIFF